METPFGLDDLSAGETLADLVGRYAGPVFAEHLGDRIRSRLDRHPADGPAGPDAGLSALAAALANCPRVCENLETRSLLLSLVRRGNLDDPTGLRLLRVLTEWGKDPEVWALVSQMKDRPFDSFVMRRIPAEDLIDAIDDALATSIAAPENRPAALALLMNVSADPWVRTEIARILIKSFVGGRDLVRALINYLTERPDEWWTSRLIDQLRKDPDARTVALRHLGGGAEVPPWNRLTDTRAGSQVVGRGNNPVREATNPIPPRTDFRSRFESRREQALVDVDARRGELEIFARSGKHDSERSIALLVLIPSVSLDVSVREFFLRLLTERVEEPPVVGVVCTGLATLVSGHADIRQAVLAVLREADHRGELWFWKNGLARALAWQTDTLDDDILRQAVLAFLPHCRNDWFSHELTFVARPLARAFRHPDVVRACLVELRKGSSDPAEYKELAEELAKPIAAVAGHPQIRKYLLEYIFDTPESDGTPAIRCGPFSDLLVSVAVSDPDFCAEMAARLFRAITEGHPVVPQELLALDYSPGLDV